MHIDDEERALVWFHFIEARENAIKVFHKQGQTHLQILNDLNLEDQDHVNRIVNKEKSFIDIILNIIASETNYGKSKRRRK